MISINLHKPGSFDINIDFPSEWNELTTPELEGIAKVMLSGFNELELVRSGMFRELFIHRCPNPALFEMLNPDDVAMYGLQLTQFILEKNHLSKQPYPTITIGGTIFYGPKDDFDELQAGEYEDVDRSYLRFQQEQNPFFLAEMAAMLWRPKKRAQLFAKPSIQAYIQYEGRTAVNGVYDATTYMHLFTALPPWQLYTIYMWWTGCKNLLMLYFDDVYEKGSGGNNKEVDYMAFTKCIHAAAGPKNGTRDMVRRTDLKAILFEMNEESKKAKELEKQYKR